MYIGIISECFVAKPHPNATPVLLANLRFSLDLLGAVAMAQRNLSHASEPQATMPFTDQALAYLEPELEFRMRYVIQEAWKMARQCKSQILLPVHVEMAYATVSGSRSSKPAKDWVSVDEQLCYCIA